MSKRTHILLVEDEEHLAVGIKFNLEAEGYQVTIRGDGASALELLDSEDHGINLAILDIMLPGMSGYTVCETIRSKGSNLGVLLLSARTLPEDRARGFDVGANQYLTKPFDLDELLSRVRNLLMLSGQSSNDKAPPSPPKTEQRFTFADAEVNFDTHEVTVGQSVIRMTKLELDLLRYFLTNEGRVIPREELLEEVWNVAPHVSTRAPDQFILRLRKAFEPDPSKPRHFLTIRDAGYRFVGDDPID